MTTRPAAAGLLDTPPDDEHYHRMATTPTLIGVTEAAELLGVARQTVLRRIDAGALIPVGKLAGRTGAYLLDADAIRPPTPRSLAGESHPSRTPRPGVPASEVAR